METKILFDFDYYYSYYELLIKEKTTEFFAFVLINFVFPLLPYVFIAIEMFFYADTQRKNYYGDGSIILFCSGILCTYFAILLENKKSKVKEWNPLIILGLILFYVITFFIFYKCQMNFSRSWCFIIIILLFSLIALIFTFIAATHLNFRSEYPYEKVKEYMLNKRKDSISEKANNIDKTDDGVAL